MTDGAPNIQLEIYAALALHQNGQLKQARLEYRKLNRRHPNNPDILHFYGMLLSQMGKTEAAIENLTKAADLAPENLDIHLNLFRSLAVIDKVPELESTLRTLVSLSPNDAFLLSQLGEILVRQDRGVEAEVFFSRAVEANPDTLDAWNGLGNILERRGEFLNAENYYLKSIAIDPTRSGAYYNLGNVLRQQNKLTESIGALKKAIELDPDFILAHVHLAFSLFMNSEFLPAWQEYEWRWKVPNFPTPKRPFTQPTWKGEELHGENVLIHAEQGFGDTIQFVRFTKLIAEKGGSVTIECQPELEALVKSAPGVVHTLARGDTLPEFDLHAPLISIPGILSLAIDDIPNDVPYLQASSEKRKYWSSQLGRKNRLKIGITWQTSNEQLSSSFKSCPLQAYEPLFKVDQVDWISLQKEMPKIDLPIADNLMDISGDLHNFEDTAAVISELDLVISMDTAVAHLAGALGKPIWLLLSTAGDWRWLKNRCDSPWYPSMRIFRQAEFNDWDGVMRQVLPHVKNLAIKKNLHHH
jgi:tetratricopeptide (TPR) repeat protein